MDQLSILLLFLSFGPCHLAQYLLKIYVIWQVRL